MTGMLEGIEGSRSRGYRLCLPFYEAAVAEAEAQAGDIGAALGRLEKALAEVQDTGERWCEAELHRIRAEVLLRREGSNIAPAEEAFQTAIAVAQQQGARSFELRGGPVARQTLPIGRPPRRGSRGPRARRSRAFRRRRKCPRSPRRRRCWRRWRRANGSGRLSKSNRLAPRCISTTPAPFSGRRGGAPRRRRRRSSAPMSSPRQRPAVPTIGASHMAGSRFRSCAESFARRWRLPRPTFGKRKSRDGRIMR